MMKLATIVIISGVIGVADADTLRGGPNPERDLATVKKWHPRYDISWPEGYCTFTYDDNSPGYTTQLACCKGAYAGQISGACLQSLPNPPTSSPTKSGGLPYYYPDYDTAWPEAGCINTAPMPSGRPKYSTQLACCKGAYGGQVSGVCLSQLPNPPTTSPTKGGGIVDYYYPDYETAWSEATCLNKAPVPFRPGDRPTYKTMIACCKGAYGGQVSGACFAALPNPPTSSPTKGGGIVDYWYPDYETAWSDATCLNKAPVPFKPGDRPTYKTMIACCKGAYGGQMSGACLSALPNPPTTSPTKSGGIVGFYYPDTSAGWANGVCTNAAPYPVNSGLPKYTTKQACCAYFGGQVSKACVCDVSICNSCSCGSQAELDAKSCGLKCT